MKFRPIDKIKDILHIEEISQGIKRLVLELFVLFARTAIRKYSPKIIAVTGSVGKTSTKEQIYNILKDKTFVWRSIKSYNHGFGVPLAILGLETGWNNPIKWLVNLIKAFTYIIWKRAYPKVLVLEIGAGAPGDIKQVMKWIKPSISVVTSMGLTPVHVEFFPSIEAVVKEKSELVKALDYSGVAILNRDDERVFSMRSLNKGHTITYGFNEESNFRASHDSITYGKDGTLSGMTFRIDFEGNSLPIKLKGVFGRGQIYVSLAAFATAVLNDIAPLEAIKGIEESSLPPGRARILPGIKGATIIDDTYNSSPGAVIALIETLRDVKKVGRVIMVLGDMMELGQYTKDEHDKVGKMIPSIATDLFTIGQRAMYIAESAKESGMLINHVFSFDEASKAGVYLEHYIKEGDLIVVKGSQSVRLEKIVEEIMAEPERAGELLVRQEKEWKRR